jgi:hypothetical protein
MGEEEGVCRDDGELLLSICSKPGELHAKDTGRHGRALPDPDKPDINHVVSPDDLVQFRTRVAPRKLL